MKYIIEKNRVRFFLSKEMFEKVEEEAIQQAYNCASLPGLVEPFCVMPDVHTGYGCPIGGVGAYDIEEGIISPGMCGYDINCLDKNTKILFRDGYYIKISKIKKYGKVLLNNCNSLNSGKISFILSKKHDKVVIIHTKWGRKLIGSLDHLVLCINGYKKMSEIKEGDRVLVYPFEGVKYKESKRTLIKYLKCDLQSTRYLKERNLLPLTTDNPNIGLIARILGYAFSDGYLEKNFRLRIYSKCYEDLLEIKKELEEINIRSSIDKNKSIYRLSINSKSFNLLLYYLGLKDKSRVPKWLFKAPKWIIRNFLAGVFGGDGSIVIIRRKDINLNLTSKHKRFLIDVKKLLKKFRVYSRIYKVNDDCYRLYISGEKNIYRFLSLIGYEYNKERRKLGNLVCEYIRRKLIIKKYKKNIFKYKLKYLDTYINSQYLTRLKLKKDLIPRISYKFETFEEFIEKYSIGDFLIDEVIKIEIKNSRKILYDLGVFHEAHNFIANGIVVHNCGVRLLKTNIHYSEISNWRELGKKLQRNIPAGLGSESPITLTKSQLEEVCINGVDWAIDKGYGYIEDKRHIEENGKIEGAEPKYISDRAYERGRDQLGSLGSGNHFAEVLIVEKIYDKSWAKKMGLFEGQICFLIHTGSRGFGHQIASDYINLMESAYKKYGIKLPDIQLACAPFYSTEGQKYWKAMKCAANYAFANRQLITHFIRETLPNWEIEILYDVCHNIVKIEQHFTKEGKRTVVIHRKGATRSFPEQPVLIPGSMGTASYVLVGTEKSLELSFGSSAHGSGRVMSRRKARREFSPERIKKDLEKKGIYVFSTTKKTAAEEAPYVYKNVDEVVKVVHEVGISKKVARLIPKIVIIP